MQIISLVRKQKFCREISTKNCKLNIYFARNYHLGDFFDKMITIKTPFASEKPSAIADCRGEFRGLKHSLYFSWLKISTKLS